MSHYNVNGSVPKTLIRSMIHWAIRTNQLDTQTASILQAILDTEISRELVPDEKDQKVAFPLPSCVA
jgi:NAD+ synthase (glutamine-hydrolysing)